MDMLTIDAWCKPNENSQSYPVGHMQFHVDEHYHLALEKAEEALETNGEKESWVNVDLKDLDLTTSEDCGELSDCQFRVYHDRDGRGQFHLVGHRAADGTLVYTNAVMVEWLG